MEFFAFVESIRARGPCFNSPAAKASAWRYVSSFNLRAPSFAIADAGPLPRQIIEDRFFS